jgi:hypothetical protein
LRAATRPADCQICQNAGNLTALGDFSQAYVAHMRERHHDGHARGEKAKKIKALLLRAEGTGTDVLNGAYAVVGINHFLADLETHSPDLFPGKLPVKVLEPMEIVNRH